MSMVIETGPENEYPDNSATLTSSLDRPLPIIHEFIVDSEYDSVDALLTAQDVLCVGGVAPTAHGEILPPPSPAHRHCAQAVNGTCTAQQRKNMTATSLIGCTVAQSLMLVRAKQSEVRSLTFFFFLVLSRLQEYDGSL